MSHSVIHILLLKKKEGKQQHAIHQKCIQHFIMQTNCSGTKNSEIELQKSSESWQAAISRDDSVCSVIMSQVCRQPPFVLRMPSSAASKDDEWPHYTQTAISVSPNKGCLQHSSFLHHWKFMDDTGKWGFWLVWF